MFSRPHAHVISDACPALSENFFNHSGLAERKQEVVLTPTSSCCTNSMGEPTRAEAIHTSPAGGKLSGLDTMSGHMTRDWNVLSNIWHHI